MPTIPIALQLYSIRHDCEKDLAGSLEPLLSHACLYPLEYDVQAKSTQQHSKGKLPQTFSMLLDASI